MEKDKLFILGNQFSDEALPGRSFYCRDCIMLHGLLAAFPAQASRLDVVRVDFPRPRTDVVALIGEENQWLPTLVFADDAPDELATGRHGDIRFVNELNLLLHALHVRHGFPEAHP